MLVLEKKINKKLNEIFLRDKHPKILVAVSGGPDSIALAFLVKKWINKRRRKGELFTVVFDHRIRHESYKEAIFVKKYLNSNNIFCKILRANKYKVVRKNMKQSRENRFSKANQALIVARGSSLWLVAPSLQVCRCTTKHQTL